MYHSSLSVFMMNNTPSGVKYWTRKSPVGQNHHLHGALLPVFLEYFRKCKS